MTATSIATLWPVLFYVLAVLALVATMIGVSSLIGERHRERATGEPYESGVASTGTARVRFDVKFYLIAVFFVIFDLEAVFLFAWAVALREAGWAGYIEMAVFIIVLAAALIYLWRDGALAWTSRGRRRGRS
jgi:NADH-quinone oxidoreductase subunit A